MVLKSDASNILGYAAALALGIVKMDLDNCKFKNTINAISELESPLITHPSLFTGRIGKLEGYQAHLEIDPTIFPCQQSAYPVPFAL